VEAGCTITPGGGELADFSSPKVLWLTPAEADRKAKPVSGLEKTPAFMSKRVPWSAETRGVEQSALRLALLLTWLLVF